MLTVAQTLMRGHDHGGVVQKLRGCPAYNDLRYDGKPIPVVGCYTLRPKQIKRSACYVTVTLMTFDKQSNGSRIVVVIA